MKNILIILPLLFLIGCYTAPPISRTPVSSMSSNGLEAEYLNLASEISTLEMELYGTYQPVRSSVPIIALSAAANRKKQINTLRLLKRRLNEVQLQRSRRGSSGLGGYP